MTTLTTLTLAAVRSLALACAFTLLVALPAHGQAGAYTVSWWSLFDGCSQEPDGSGGRLPAHAQGHGLAVATASPRGGVLLRFAGPGGEGHIETDAANSAVDVSFPSTCGQFSEFTTLTLLPSQSDADAGFTFRTRQGSGRVSGEAFGVGSAARVGVEITSPAEGATVAGSVPVRASVSGVIAGVPLVYRLAASGRTLGSVSGTAPSAAVTISAPALGPGSHRLELTVADKFGTALATAARTVIVGAGGAPAAPPPSAGSVKVFITSPRVNATARGSVAVNIWVEGAAAGPSTFTLAVDGRTVATRTCACVHVWPVWDTTLFANGAHTLSVTVADSAGKRGAASLTVLVGN